MSSLSMFVSIGVVSVWIVANGVVQFRLFIVDDVRGFLIAKNATVIGIFGWLVILVEVSDVGIFVGVAYGVVSLTVAME